MPEIERIAESYDITPIMSENARYIDTRFGRGVDFANRLEQLSRKSVICSIKDAEPIGPKALLDVLVVAPCTGNTLAKLANGITDTAVTLAVKAHLRNNRPVVIALATNDALGGNAGNIGALLARKNFYFVPFRQDDTPGKPNSMVAEMSLIDTTLELALQKRQIQPMII